MPFISSSNIALVAMGLLAAANPLPQDFEFDLIKALPVPTYTTTLSSVPEYNPTSVLVAAIEQITSTVDAATLTPNATPIPTIARRDTACQPQPAGATGAPAVADDPVSFVNSPDFASIALNAPQVDGYTQTFVNLNASNNAYGYMGYTTLQTYDVQTCANKCQKINGCMSFNIYFERDPSENPASACPNPCSVTMIKCAFWGGPVNKGNAVNYGQWRQDFKVVIAGSNGYQNNSIATPPGYTTPTYLGNAAINAPVDTYGYESYMGAAVFTSGPFDIALCAKACTAKSTYNLAHPPKDGSPVTTCKFFNTYILYVNTTQNVQGQYCAMYSESWPTKYATNKGQYRGNDHYKLLYSYSASNATDGGVPCRDCGIAQATRDINYWTLQPFCSTLLGYTNAAVATVFTTTTTTPIIVTVPTSTVTSTATATETTTTQAVARRATSSAPAAALSTPNILTRYPSDVLSTACGKIASPVAVTSTTTSTATITDAPSIIAVPTTITTVSTTTVTTVVVTTF